MGHEANDVDGEAVKKKRNVIAFKTIGELHALPLEKIDAFCTDLALWLKIHKVTEAQEGIKARTPRDQFDWIDDGKHNINVTLHVKHEQ